MHGRATAVVLPALLVLALVAVVGIAATGSTPSGSGETRPLPTSLYDTLFTLWLVAVVAGGLLALYGLTQRKAIAREVATGRYRRSSIVGYLVFVALFAAFSQWRLSDLKLRREQADDGAVFSGDVPDPSAAADRRMGDVPYEPTITWIPIVVVILLALTAVSAYVAAERRGRRGRGGRVTLAERLADVLDETLDDLRAEADPRRAVIAAYARLERVLAANGIPRRLAETSDEYLDRVLRDLELAPAGIERLTSLFTQAKFSQHEIDAPEKEEAIGALEAVRDELRAAHGHHDPEPGPVTMPSEANAS